ncbi:MAG: hypothetical protein A2512_10615 [Deltaproteobacteria bacterium RIFOXYD12_FULL_56_24]|nr:MAG: hypothetical protein A2512_10615 [Deltaproteobacteria bacterium RIFOXYD12_FULL_56_24]
MERGHEIVAIVTLSDSLVHDDSHIGFPIVRLPRARFRPLRWLQTIVTIYRLARLSDVVYLNGLVLEGILATKIFSHRLSVIKVVGDLIWEKARNAGATNLELDAFQSARLPLRWRLLRRLQGWYTSRADAVITPSRYLSKIICGWGVSAGRIHTIYNAVTISSTTSAEAPSPRYDLVTVARLVPWKGIAGLIEVAADHGWSLRIVGDGLFGEELEALARQCGAKVSFAGHVAHEQVADEIRSARLFVLNSTYEGLPHIVLEAKAAGVAVLASDAGGTPETIRHGENGWLVPVGDNTALAAGIRRLLDDDTERSRLAEAGRRQVAESFSFAIMADATETALAGVCR